VLLVEIPRLFAIDCKKQRWTGDIVEFWAYLPILAAVSALSLTFLETGLIQERMRPGGCRVPAHPRMEIEKMTDEADETFIRRLQFLASSLRRRDEAAVADDLEAVIRFKRPPRRSAKKRFGATHGTSRLSRDWKKGPT